MLRYLLILCCLPALYAGCGSPSGTARNGGISTVAVSSAAITRVTGTAQNAKGGAVVIDDAGGVYYIDGKADWNAEGLTGRRVIVSGTLIVVQHPDTDLLNARGEHSAGMTGEQRIIKEAVFEPVQ